jgi:hypothetical protein
VKRSALLLITIFAAGLFSNAFAQGMKATPPPSPAPLGKVTTAAVWQPSQDVLTKARNFCDKSMGAASFPECFMNQLAAAGAPAESVAFTRALYQQSDGQVGVMSAFKNYGTVALAQVMYPLRANDNYGLLFVNTDPNLLDADDLKKLDQAMSQDALFQSIKKQYPQTDVWPGDRSGKDPWPLVKSLPEGEMEFVVTYPLINGCHACQRVGIAGFGWDFDASGKFLKTVYIPTPPPSKTMKRPHGAPPQQ